MGLGYGDPCRRIGVRLGRSASLGLTNRQIGRVNAHPKVERRRLEIDRYVDQLRIVTL